MSGLEPLVKSITVPIPPEQAFTPFTDEIAAWWPLATHSVAAARAVRCVFEARPGGRIYEVRDDGFESE